MYQRNVIPKSKALTGLEDAVAIELETLAHPLAFPEPVSFVSRG